MPTPLQEFVEDLLGRLKEYPARPQSLYATEDELKLLLRLGSKEGLLDVDAEEMVLGWLMAARPMRTLRDGSMLVSVVDLDRAAACAELAVLAVMPSVSLDRAPLYIDPFSRRPEQAMAAWGSIARALDELLRSQALPLGEALWVEQQATTYKRELQHMRERWGL